MHSPMKKRGAWHASPPSHDTKAGPATDLEQFPAGRQAALARLNAVDPQRYAKSRNFLNGAVSGLSPYVTHGMVSLKECAAVVHGKHRLSFEDKWAFELGWRAFFHHAGSHLGKGVYSDQKPAPYRGPYQKALPSDIARGATGVAVIDHAVRTLYRTGYLHNHMRMWLASYVVHFRKVHWLAGAQWMHAHLLDGDVFSNHLSWQWVASTFSSKPYVFNSDNVERYAGRTYASRGTVIDQSYETLDDLARTQADCGPEPGEHPGVSEPDVFYAPPESLMQGWTQMSKQEVIARWEAAETEQPVHWMHPFGIRPAKGQAHTAIAWFDQTYHAQHAWSAKRWSFVLEALREHTHIWVWLDTAALSKSGARLSGVFHPHPFMGYRAMNELKGLTALDPERWLPDPDLFCKSFTRFYEQATRRAKSFEHTLA